MSARKIEDITIFSDERYYCGPGPAVVAFPNGELIVFFRRHRSWTSEPFFTHVHPTTGMCMTRSTEGGKRWSLPRVIVAGGQCAGATLLKDGRILFTTHRSEPVPVELAAGPPNQPNDGVPEMFRRRPRQWGGVAAGTEMWLSADRGETWDGPNWLGEMPGVPPLVRGLHTPVQHRGFPVELSNGDIAMTVQAAPGSIFYISENRGRTWRFRAIAAPHLAEDKQFNEWTVRETPAGDLVGFLRSKMPPGKSRGLLWTVRSSDGGRTWSPPEQRTVWGHPFYPLPLPDGRALLVYGHRRQPFGIRCRVLDPQCGNTDEAEEVVLRDDGGSFDLGYPHAACSADGRVLVVYYFNTGGQRFVAGTWVEIA